MPKFWWLKFNGVVSVDAFALTIGKSSCEFFIARALRRLWSLEPSMHKELKGGAEEGWTMENAKVDSSLLKYFMEIQ